MTKEQLIKMLQEDKQPMDTEISIYLDCINNDISIVGSVNRIEWNENFKSLMILGEYEESEY